MLMKMHTNMATNGYLRRVSQQSTELLFQLRDAASQVGGRVKTISEAMKHRKGLERESDADSSNTGTSSTSTPTPELSHSVNSSCAQVPTTTAIRNRLVHTTAHIDTRYEAQGLDAPCTNKSPRSGDICPCYRVLGARIRTCELWPGTGWAENRRTLWSISLSR